MSTSIFGSVVLRTEDPRFIRGEGRYTESVDVAATLQASFVRSMMAHARVARVDVSASTRMPGVAAVFAAPDLDLAPQPPSGSVSGVRLTPPDLRLRSSEAGLGPFRRTLLVRAAKRGAEPIAACVRRILADPSFSLQEREVRGGLVAQQFVCRRVGQEDLDGRWHRPI